jgi:16S rRNA pseudouridine516 synthase
MRLDQFIASSTALTRKDARKAIKSGRVHVNETPCKSAGTKIDARASITLDGQPCTLPGERYLMLNKPAGVVSATRDSDHPTALDLLPPELTPGLHIAGRLDADTTGLLLLTTDGHWSHRVTSPRVNCPKTYRVTLHSPLPEQAVHALEQGLLLRNDPVLTKPAQVKLITACEMELTIFEGRYHQVKRMLATTGNHVVALHRLRIGDIVLDPELQPGDYRALTAAETGCVT